MNGPNTTGRSFCTSCGQIVRKNHPQPFPSIIEQLRTNSPPRDVKPDISWEKAVIADLDEDILHYTNIIAGLEGKRTAHLRSMSELECIQAPVRRLPFEIISRIVKECIPPTNASGLPKDSINYQLMSLSHVSFTWRTVILSDPSLWQRVDIRYESKPEYLFWLLENSSQLPLLINVKCLLIPRDRRVYEYSILFSKAFDQVMAQSERWKSLSFDALPDDIFSILSPIKGRIPLLESLEIGDGQSEEPVDGTETPFEEAPSLREVSISFPLNASTVTLPWHQLTTLHSVGLSYLDFLTMLGDCSQLQFCRGLDIYAGESLPANVVVASHLRRLILSIEHTREPEGEGGDIFSFVAFPSLRAATLLIPEQFWLEPIKTMFQSSPKITYLTIHSPTADYQEVTDLVECLPALRHLDLHFDCDRPVSQAAWFGVIAGEEDHTQYLLTLEHFCVFMHGYCPNQDAADEVAFLLKHRCHNRHGALLVHGTKSPRQLTFVLSFDCKTIPQSQWP